MLAWIEKSLQLDCSSESAFHSSRTSLMASFLLHWWNQDTCFLPPFLLICQLVYFFYDRLPFALAGAGRLVPYLPTAAATRQRAAGKWRKSNASIWRWEWHWQMAQLDLDRLEPPATAIALVPRRGCSREQPTGESGRTGAPWHIVLSFQVFRVLSWLGSHIELDSAMKRVVATP